MANEKFICLIGPHRSGKSTIGRYLHAELGYIRAHPFNPGRAAVAAWLFHHRQTTLDVVRRYVDGDLKDSFYDPTNRDPNAAPNPENRRTMRQFLDAMGKFTGNDLGAEWTIELDILRRETIDPHARIDITGYDSAQALAAGYMAFAGMPDQEIRSALTGGEDLGGEYLPDGTSGQELLGRMRQMFVDYGMEDWNHGSLPAEANPQPIEPLYFMAEHDFVENSPGYVLESCAHEIDHIRNTRQDYAIVTLVKPDHEIQSDGIGTAKAWMKIIPDVEFRNPMESPEDTGEKFVEVMNDHGFFLKTCDTGLDEPS